MNLVLRFAFWYVCLQIALCAKYRPSGVKISDYEKYLEDQTLIGKEIECDDEEKECFKFGRVLFNDSKCYKLSHEGPCKNGGFYFNKKTAQEGKYVPECGVDNKCGHPYLRFMGYDQTCYTHELIEDICDEKKNLTFATNFFGEGYCRCIGDNCPPRPQVTQPEEQGRCRIPDLVGSEFESWDDPLVLRSFPCSTQEAKCFQESKMLHSDGRCYPVLERGPCVEGEIFAANKTVFRERGWLLGACQPESCDKGSVRRVRMQHDGKCYDLKDVRDKLCPPHFVVFDVFGEVGCLYEERKIENTLPIVRDGECRSGTGWI